MKGFFIVTVLFLIILAFCFGISYGVDNRRGLQSQPPPPQYRQPSQGTQPQQPQTTRPILPPVVPSGSLGVFPTASPHISTPSIFSTTITPTTQTSPKLSHPITQNIPSAAAQPPALPHVSVRTSMAHVSVPKIGYTTGKVLDIGSEQDGTNWVMIEDELFDKTLKIKVRNLKNTPIVKQGKITSFSDIKIGDTLSVVYISEAGSVPGVILSPEAEENVAASIQILTKEDLELMGIDETGLIIVPEELPEDAEPVAAEEKDFQTSE